MSQQPLLLGIDVGTTNIKAIAFAPNGSPVAQASCRTVTHHHAKGGVFYDPEETWQQVLRLIQDVVKQIDSAATIISIGVASYGETGVPIDKEGRPTYEAIAWYDDRTIPQAQWLESTIGLETLFRITGVALQPILGLCKILWLYDNAPEAFARMNTWLNMADYITYRLCGIPATDYSLASRMICMDLAKREWATDLLQQVGLDPTILAPLVPGGTPLGPLLPELVQATGLSAATHVAVGGHDHVCGALALGVTKPADVLNSIGTSEAIFVPVSSPITAPHYGKEGYTQGVHIAGDYYSFGGLYTSGAAVDWFRRNFANNGDHAMLIAEADAVAAGADGAFFLPHLRQSSPPHLDLQARGGFIGLQAEMDRGVLFRALLEGLAYEMRYSLEPLLRHGGIEKAGTIHVCGGGAHNRLYNQIKASVLNHPLTVVDVKETTALGAALLGGLGVGLYHDLADALAQLHHEQTIVEPLPDDAGLYEANYQAVYKQLYTTLSSLHRATNLNTAPENQP